MRVDVFFGGQMIAPPDVAGRVVVVIDVLRASTSIATALSNGARAVIPFETSEEAVTRAKAFERSEVKLAGERRMRAIAGFDLGNSPLEFTREAIEGKTVLMSTTNGTPAIVNSAGARDIVIASYVNYTAVLTMLRAALRGGTDVTVVCAGRERQFSLEDAGCAGHYVYNVVKRLGGANVELNDAAQACSLIDRKYGDQFLKLFDASEHGRALREAGFADDLTACAALDAHPVIPIYQDRQITKLGPDRER
ncbi:MAG TPA: 2-phosphosulfolactate phosphatase [Gemmatimonadaceae bacterium]|nr:2-phosphosulfolactate phosphatase [Gemmatimonadaceae bacterium]